MLLRTGVVVPRTVHALPVTPALGGRQVASANNVLQRESTGMRRRVNVPTAPPPSMIVPALGHVAVWVVK